MMVRYSRPHHSDFPFSIVIEMLYQPLCMSQFLEINASQSAFLACAVCIMTAEELVEEFEDFELHSKNFVFFPVNDNVTNRAMGGSHWFERKKKILNARISPTITYLLSHCLSFKRSEGTCRPIIGPRAFAYSVHHDSCVLMQELARVPP